MIADLSEVRDRLAGSPGMAKIRYRAGPRAEILNETVRLKNVEPEHAVRFLASEEAGHITGHVLKVNGRLLIG